MEVSKARQKYFAEHPAAMTLRTCIRENCLKGVIKSTKRNDESSTMSIDDLLTSPDDRIAAEPRELGSYLVRVLTCTGAKRMAGDRGGGTGNRASGSNRRAGSSG
jgi:hypothetical protein